MDRQVISTHKLCQCHPIACICLPSSASHKPGLSAQASTRTYRGHLNEKNFVGLSADGEFIACGSEQNEVSGRRPHQEECKHAPDHVSRRRQP